MPSVTNFITDYRWENTLIVLFCLIDEACLILYDSRNLPRERGPEPTFADSEVITLAVWLETYHEGHEERAWADLEQHYRHLFPDLIDRSRFNRRRRDLADAMEEIRRFWNRELGVEDDDIRTIDSLPIHLCAYVRGSRCRSIPITEPVELERYFGVVPSKKAKFFGLRLHFTTLLNALVDRWLLAPASIHDLKPMPSLLEDYEDILVIGDKAYNDADLEERLRRQRNVDLRPIRRVNQKHQWSPAMKAALSKARHWAENAGSILTTVYNIEHLGSRSWSGHIARVTTKLLAFTMAFVLTAVLPTVFGN